MKTVYIEGLGLCEHCGCLINIEDAPSEAMDAEWRCPFCEKVLSEKSFGYETIGGECKKMRWVGGDGKWISIKPIKEFVLGDLKIIVKQSRIYIP